MDNQLVSIVIPTHKRPDLLKKTIESVQEQTYKNIEIVVVDDNPSDSVARKETEELMRRFSAVTYIKHEKNQGANVARNTGIKVARGKYIGFLDDDDEYLPTMVERQMRVISEHGENVAVFGGSLFIEENAQKYSSWMTKGAGNLFRPSKEEVICANAGGGILILISKKNLLEVGGFDVSFSACQDWDLRIRLSLAEVNFIGIKEPLVKVYRRKNRERITTDKNVKLQALLCIFDKYESVIVSKYPGGLALFYQYMLSILTVENKKVAGKFFMQHWRFCFRPFLIFKLLFWGTWVYDILKYKISSRYQKST